LAETDVSPSPVSLPESLPVPPPDSLSVSSTVSSPALVVISSRAEVVSGVVDVLAMGVSSVVSELLAGSPVGFTLGELGAVSPLDVPFELEADGCPGAVVLSPPPVVSGSSTSPLPPVSAQARTVDDRTRVAKRRGDAKRRDMVRRVWTVSRRLTTTARRSERLGSVRLSMFDAFPPLTAPGKRGLAPQPRFAFAGDLLSKTPTAEEFGLG